MGFGFGLSLPAYATVRGPSLALVFAGAETLDPAVTFTRTTTGTYTDSSGLITTAAINVPRFDYNPTTGESLGLLIEEQRTNLVTYSEQFGNAAWNKNDVTITNNDIISPDGTLTADLIIANTASAIHGTRFPNITATTSLTYTFSVYAKQAAGTYEFVIAVGASTSANSAWNSSNRAHARFNLTTGTAGTLANSGSASAISSSITPVGNGWYRCSFTFIPDTTGASITLAPGFVSIPTGQTPVLAWTGDGTSGSYAWGAQLDAGAFPTSYIATVASQVTRAADSATMTGANFSSWYNQTEGTIYVDVGSAVVDTIIQHAVSISDGTADNTFTIRRTAVGTVRGAAIVGAVAQGDITSGGAIAPSAVYETAFAYKINNLAVSTNSASIGSDELADIPAVDRLFIGANAGGLVNLNGHIRSISYYPRRLSNAELQAITS